MKELLRYFFGAGSEPEFALITPAHFTPILLLIGILFLLYHYREFFKKKL